MMTLDMRRKKIYLSLLLIFTSIFGLSLSVSCGSAQLAGQEAGGGLPAVFPRYEIDIALDFDKHTVDVREKLTVKNGTDREWTRLAFCVTQAVHPEVFALNRFLVAVQNETQAVTPVVRSSMLTVDLTRPVRPGEEARVEIDFRLTLRKLDLHEIHPGGNLGYNSLVTQCGDCFATLTPFDPDRGFREWDYAPVGDPFIYPPAAYDVRLTTAPDVTVAAAGLSERKGGDWRFTLERGRSFAFTASRLYAVTRRQAGAVNISCFYVKGYERQAEVMLQTATECVELFGKLYGPYQGRELVLAQDAYGSAMEYSNFITVAQTYIKDYTPAKPQLLLYLVAHETSHQWWYNAVGSDQVMEPWLDEGLAKYSEYLYFRAWHPQFTEWWRSLTVVQRPADRFIDDTIYEFAETPRDYSRVIYGLAPAFLLELHQKIGEQSFFEFLRDYYHFGTGRFVTAADFFTILSRHTDADITPLLRKYFRNPPRLEPEKTGP
jgi:hypothetical protein